MYEAAALRVEVEEQFGRLNGIFVPVWGFTQCRKEEKPGEAGLKCSHCGKELPTQFGSGRPREFCSKTCWRRSYTARTGK